MSNVEALRAVYAGYEQGDFRASLPLLHETLTLTVDPEIPDGGTYEGTDGVRAYMSRFLEPWESLTISAESYEDAGNRVLVKVHQAGIGRGSGVPVTLDYFQLWTFSGDKVVRLEVIMSEERAREALGQPG